ncbi:hypothetical protein HLB44_08975 [Aquincola sp. S2]|uniref:PH domain-containing protein n=1 Tax=Pseudaquabacterium terrae TaxID=2732868 RepID=A0ABX2EEQ5_9BURK|nr:hypothetical protein [Aquabacterium terrae]NRF67112.1 hypothetical protein [Aquabacterium terrae]
MQGQLEFPYKTVKRVLPMLIVAVAMPAACAYTAWTNTRGLRIAGFITATASQATTIYWCLAVITAPVLPVVIWTVLQSRRAPLSLVLGPTSITLPRASLRGEWVEVPYAAIQKTGVEVIGPDKLFVVVSTLGRFNVARSGFRGSDDFGAFAKALGECVGARPPR